MIIRTRQISGNKSKITKNLRDQTRDSQHFSQIDQIKMLHGRENVVVREGNTCLIFKKIPPQVYVDFEDADALSIY